MASKTPDTTPVVIQPVQPVVRDATAQSLKRLDALERPVADVNRTRDNDNLSTIHTGDRSNKTPEEVSQPLNGFEPRDHESNLPFDHGATVGGTGGAVINEGNSESYSFPQSMVANDSVSQSALLTSGDDSGNANGFWGGRSGLASDGLSNAGQSNGLDFSGASAVSFRPVSPIQNDAKPTSTPSNSDDNNDNPDNPGSGGITPPGLAVGGGQGREDAPIPVNIALSSGNGTTSITISGVPAGATLSAGTNNGNGTWTLTPGQLAGLTITPPSNFNGNFNLTVTATISNGAGQSASTTTSIGIKVADVADTPSLTVTVADGAVGQSVPVTITLTSPDLGGPETVRITITGVPQGASLSAGTNNGNGTWTLTPAQLQGLMLNLPTSDADFSLVVTATSTGSAGAPASTTVTAPVHVEDIEPPDTPTLSVGPATGTEDQPIAVTIGASLVTPGAGETLTVTISGVPAGATLSAGINNGDGTWTLTPAQLVGLTITPPVDFNGTLNLTVTATATDAGGGQASTSAPLSISVDGVADAPTLSVGSAAGVEDQQIALTIGASLVAPAPGETLTITVSGVPAGATLSAGIDNGDGTWTLTPAQLAGLTITPPADFSGTLALTVTATATDAHGGHASTSTPLNVSVAGEADAPTLAVGPATGIEDQPIALTIGASLVSPSAGETLSITISGVPAGAVLSAGTNNGDGTWTLTPAQLVGLTITPPADFNGTLNLTVTATATDANGGQATTSTPLSVTITGEADAPTLAVGPATGLEDQPIALTIGASLVSPAPGETLTVTISGVPAGATLSAGTNNGDGTWTLTPAQLVGLTITPPADFSGTLNLTVTATANDGHGGQASSSTGLNISVTGTADAPTLAVGPATGSEDQPIALTIGASLVTPAPGETLAITVSGVPAGATLSAGTNNGDGTWTLTPTQLVGLTITPPTDFNGTLNLTVTATATDANGGQATTSTPLSVTVESAADAPNLTVTPADGLEDQAIAIDISATSLSSNPGDVLSITISGVPAGAVLSAGTNNGNGTWTLTPAQLAGLTITPAPNSDADFNLTVTATVRETNGSTASTSAPLHVNVEGVADQAIVTVTPANGQEDNAIQLNIGAALRDTDGSETLGSITISGVPAGATLSAGINNGNGTWTLTPAQLAGLSLTPPEDFNGTINLTVTVQTVEQDGDTATVSTPLSVTVSAVADAPVLTVAPATGNEDTAVALDISAALGSVTASETLSITILGVPNGAVLSAGINNGNGTWTLTPAQLAGLTITPAPNSDADFTLTVTATAREANGNTATTSANLPVTIAAIADTPTLSTGNVVGAEDTHIALNISASLTDTDGSETLTIIVSGVPAGATLSAGIDNGDGTWTLSKAQLQDLTIAPPEDYSGTINLTVTATASEARGNSTSVTQSFSVTVDPVSDTPDVTVIVGEVTGGQPVPVEITILANSGDIDGSETLTITVSGIPGGASLSAGTNMGGGVWQLTPEQLLGLHLIPPAGGADFTMQVTVTSVDGTAAPASVTTTMHVNLDGTGPVAPTVHVQEAVGNEDTPVALSITGTLDDPATETLTVVVSGVPAGAILSAGVDNGDGTWTLTAGQLAGLTITPPADFSGTITLNVEAIATNGQGDHASATSILIVDVKAVADAPTLAVAPATGLEDQPIALAIASSLVSPAAGETLSVTISGVPAGAVLSAGTNNGDGTWTLTAGQLAGLTITPPADFNGTLNLTVTATATGPESDHASTTVPLSVIVTSVADAPALVVTPATGSEDHPIALTLAASLVSPGAGETLSVTISGVPAGAVLSAGINNGDGTWTLTPAQLSGLTLTPPADFNGTIALAVTATADDGNGGQASTSAPLNVSVGGVADAPTLAVAAAAGVEDQPIALAIASSLVSPAAGETLAITISGIPAGATLSAGTNNGNGTWTLTPAQLAGLTITPPADFNGTLNLTVTATATDTNGGHATTSAPLSITVDGVADAPILTVGPATGLEDQPIALTIASSLVSPNAGETLSVTISGVPAGATLSAGTDNGDGTWTLTPAQLVGLTITPPADYSGSINLTVTATANDGHGGQASTSAPLSIAITGVADAPTLSVAPSVGVEDQPIALTLAASLVSPSAGETLAITVSGVPAGAVLSAGINNGNGTWTLTPAQLAGLTITPPTNFNGTLNLTVTATATDAQGGHASTSTPLSVTVDGVADAPTLAVGPAVGVEDQPIALTIGASLVSPAAGETLAVTISGVPAGAVLSAGTNNGDGTWTLTPAQLAGLTITPPADFSGTLNLSVTATATDSHGGHASTSTPLSVSVAGTADAPTLAVAAAIGQEDQPIAITIASSLVSPSAGETLAITVSGVPAGATLSAGINNGNGTWTLTAAQLSGLTITPPHDFNGTLNLTVTATATDANGGQATTSTGLSVTVEGVADAPTLAVSPATGLEDQPIALAIASSLVAPAAGETLAITVSGVPAGAVLSAGINNGNGTWTLTPAQLAGLTITPPADFNGTLNLTVTATATDSHGGHATTSTPLSVTVTGVADGPTLAVTPAAGLEDQPIALTIASSLVSPNAGETLAVTISGVPVGAVLSAGINNGNGTWTLTPAQLAGLTITPPQNYSGSINLTVTATANDGHGGQASTSAPLSVAVTGVADPAIVNVSPAIGLEDSAISLNISATLVDNDGSETATIIIGNVPAGAVLSAGINNGNGTWTLTSAQLAGLTITPPHDFNGSIALSVRAVTTENTGDTTSTLPVTLTVTVNPAAEAPILTVTPATGNEDQPIALAIAASVAGVGETLGSITISGVPAGATLSAGINNGNGTWTLTAAQLAGLTFTPPANASGNFTLTVTATSHDGTASGSTTANLAVHVTGVADAPILSASAVTGNEDNFIPLNISASLRDTDGSETLTIRITGLPAGAVLNHGVQNPDGSWSLTAADLNGLAIRGSANYSGNFTITVSATATETDGHSSTSTTPVQVTVTPVADQPTLTVQSASGGEDTGIALNIQAGLVDTDGSETLSITISGIPAGAVLSAGTNNGNGTWTLSPGQLQGLTITPPHDFSGTINLTVTATSTETNGQQATRSSGLAVNVTGVADAPGVTAGNVSGSEDHAISLNLSAALTDTDGSESLQVKVTGVPAGAVLSAGINNGDGTWTLTASQLQGLTITPPHDFSGTITLGITATASEGTTTAATAANFTVTVTAVADVPTLTVQHAHGFEDTAIPLNITAQLNDTDGSETLSIKISGVPAGATLNKGINNGDGTWTLTPAQLTGLTITPPPDSNADFNLTITATATEGNGNTATNVTTLPVEVRPVADAPLITANLAVGLEDLPIPLALTATLANPDGSDILSVTLSGVPLGAQLNHGVFKGIGSDGCGIWSIGLEDLPTLTLTAPKDYHGTITLSLHATVSDGDAPLASVSVNFQVQVIGVLDLPTLGLNLGVAAGVEDQWIPVNLVSAVVQLGSVENVDSIVISGLPAGAMLSAGINNGNGTWTLTAAQLAGLSLKPPPNSDADFILGVRVNVSDSNGHTGHVDGPLAVVVSGQADTPTVTAAATFDTTNKVINLTIAGSLTDTDGSEHLSYIISGIPAGARLSAGWNNGDGTWTLTPSQLAGLILTPPTGFTGNISLNVMAVSQEDGTTAYAQTTVNANVTVPNPGLIGGLLGAVGGILGAVLLPTVDMAEDTVGNLTFVGLSVGGLASVKISNVPAGALLSVGINNGDGSWTLTPIQLSLLKYIPAPNDDTDIQLKVEVKLAGITIQTGLLNVIVHGVADAPIASVVTGQAIEGQPISLNLTGTLVDTDGSEVLSYIVRDLPAGVMLSAGIKNPVTGVWTISPADLVNLKIIPPDGFSGVLNFNIGVISTELEGSSAITLRPVSITVAAVAEVPLITVGTSAGLEDTAIKLNVGVALQDLDGSETLASIEIAGVPAGSVLNHGTNLGNGVWRLTAADLIDLRITPPHDFSGSFDLTVTARSLDGGVLSATASATMTVNVTATADLPLVGAANVTGLEGTAINLNLTAALTDLDGSEHLSVVVSGLPVGAHLSAGLNNGDGTWTLTASQLVGLTLTPPSNYSGDLHLTVTALARETATGQSASASVGFDVHVIGVADTPLLTLSTAVGVENMPVELDIQAALTDVDGSEILSLTISGLPAGCLLSRGVDNHNGTWTLTANDLTNLYLIAPNGFHGDFNLTVTATARETAGGAGASVSAGLHVTIEDAPASSFMLTVNEQVHVAPDFQFGDDTGQLFGAVITLDAGLHLGDALTLGGLNLVTDENGRTMIASTGIEVVDGGFDPDSGCLLLEGVADRTTYEDIFQALCLEPGDGDGMRSVTIDVADTPNHYTNILDIDVNVDLQDDMQDGSIFTSITSFSDSFGIDPSSGQNGVDQDGMLDIASHVGTDPFGDADATLLNDTSHLPFNELARIDA